MVDNIVFSMSDKRLLLALHEAAMRNSKELKNSKEFVIANSGLAENSKVDPQRNDLQSLLKKDVSKLKMFNSKSNMYEIGIVVLPDGMKKYIDSMFSNVHEVSKEDIPVKLYQNDIYAKFKTQADELKDKAYEYIVSYMTSFCGEKYAKSIPKDKIVCEAYPSDDDALKSKDGILGESNKKFNKVGVVLYKIGYSVGAKK